MRKTENGLQPGRKIWVVGKGKNAEGTFIKFLPDHPGWCEYLAFNTGQFRLAQVCDVRIQLKKEKENAKRRSAQ